jgi:hypothetical protein
VDSSGNAYVTGHTWSSSFPCVNALNGSFGGVSDAFVTKIASDPPDTIAATGSITINGGASYANSMTVTMNLSATDNTGVTGYYISGNSATPSASDSGWTSVTSTTSYSGNVSYTLNGGEGDKTIYVWYKDAEDNVSSTTSATITFDTTVPTVTISDPTLNSTYTTTNSTITLDGSADDSVSGISSVAWSNDRGENGTAIGTVSWSISSISLSIGDNIITVTATDGAGNTGTDTITVPYAIPTMPTAVTRLAINVSSASAQLKGKVIPNELPTTAWFEYGTTSGSYSNQTTRRNAGDSKMSVMIDEEISGLSSGTTYYYQVVAENGAGTAYGKEMSFTTK